MPWLDNGDVESDDADGHLGTDCVAVYRFLDGHATGRTLDGEVAAVLRTKYLENDLTWIDVGRQTGLESDVVCQIGHVTSATTLLGHVVSQRVAAANSRTTDDDGGCGDKDEETEESSKRIT